MKKIWKMDPWGYTIDRGMDGYRDRGIQVCMDKGVLMDVDMDGF